MDIRKGTREYIERMTEIRTLSTPSLDGIEDADAYGRVLRENFVRIGKLAGKNRELLEEGLYPLLNSDGVLTKEEAAAMISFSEELLDAEELENMDLPITAMVAERLMKNARTKGDFSEQIRQMDTQMSILYALTNMTGRISTYPEISASYRDKGMELGEQFLSLREPERFKEIEDRDCRELVLTNARFLPAFFENIRGDRDVNGKIMAMMRNDLAISESDFYHSLVPDYDWDYYRFRVLEYFALCTDSGNARGFDGDQLKEILERTEELWEMWHADPEKYREFDDEQYLKFLLLRNRFLAGVSEEEEHRDALMQMFRERKKDCYDLCGIAENILLPVEILCLLKDRRLSEPDKAMLLDFYNNIILYTFHMPNSGILSFMLEYNSYFIRSFREVPEGMRFEDIILSFLAAMHPPTYVHSRMVAQFTVCLCDHLIDLKPELLIGCAGCTTVEEVLEKRSEILYFAYHAALCHDTGKLFIIDTVFVYGRKLLDMEFDLIKTHPKMGAELLRRYPSTRGYAEVALGHHKWYDNSRGYPEDFDTSKSPLKALIDLVMCCDCLDAATDTVGRSYSRGKTTEEFLEEVREGSGTRYAPWLVDLLAREDVRADINFLLQRGREHNYQDTYLLLRNVQQHAIYDA